MPTTSAQPATTPIPVQLSAAASMQCLLPHLSMPKRGPQYTLGYHRVFNLISMDAVHRDAMEVFPRAQRPRRHSGNPFEFIPIKSSVAKGSGAPGSYGGHS